MDGRLKKIVTVNQVRAMTPAEAYAWLLSINKTRPVPTPIALAVMYCYRRPHG